MQEFVIDSEKVLDETVIIDKQPLGGIADHNYLSPNMKELFIKLQEFGRGQETIALLMGAKSIGKTTFLKYFQAENPSSCYWVQGQAKLELGQLLAKNFLEVEPETSLSPESSLDYVLQELSKKFQHFTLIIDDADQLSLESFQQILSAFCKQTLSACKVILAGDVGLEKRVTSLSDDTMSFPFKSFCLLPLSFFETQQYLKDFYPHITNRNNISFTKKAVKKIFHLSKGYLGRINRVSLQFASESRVAPIVLPRKKSFLDFLLALGILCLLGIVGFRISVMILAKSNVKPATKPAADVVLIAMKQPALKPALFNDDTTPNYIASIENLPEISLIPEITLPEPRHNSIPSKKRVVEVKAVKIQGYTLQLVAAHQKNTLISWLETLRSQKFAHLCKIKKVNESWHVLNYGFYHTRQQAEYALSRLPNKVKNQKPLIRALT